MDQVSRNDIYAMAGTMPQPLPETEPGRYQALLLDGLSVITALFFGLGYRLYLAQAFSPWTLIGLLFAFGIMTGLHAILAANKGRRLLVILFEVIAIGFFFYNFDPVFLSCGLALLYVFLAWGYLQTRRDLAYSTTIRFFKNTHGILGKFITATLLFMVLMYVPQLTPGATFVPQKTFTGFFDWSAGIVETWYPSIPLTGSVSDLAQELVQSQLAGNSATAPAPSDASVAANASALIGSFSKSLGVVIHATDTVPSVAYAALENTLTDWRIRFASVFLLGWTIVVFFVLRSVGIIFVWISQVLLIIVYEILLGLKLITIKQEPATREVITYR